MYSLFLSFFLCLLSFFLSCHLFRPILNNIKPYLTESIGYLNSFDLSYCFTLIDQLYCNGIKVL